MEAIKEHNQKICISIFPDGIQPSDSEKVEMPAHINFSTPESKERYVEREMFYTRHQYKEYGGSVSREDRFRARERLESARVVFAKSMNYGPTKDATGKVRDKWQWHFIGKDEPTEIA